MPKRIKWILALLFALASVVIVQAALDEILYMPLARNGYPLKATPTPIPGIYMTDLEYRPTPNPLDEFVEIQNIDIDPLESMGGWTLRDENANVYTFPTFSLMANDSVKVWTKAGQDWPWDLYWGMNEPVWNDHGDCAYLRDENKNLVDKFCYGSLAQSVQP
jgi:hypothetical protein